MPTMREANAQGTRDLGRELEVIRPYLEILKVRMEERLQTDVRVPDGLLSADFPPMMLQSLVENAIKHGLEPKPEGGKLTLSAEIVHGKLAVTVSDTGLGFGKAPTAGTGIGLNNIRERLQIEMRVPDGLLSADFPPMMLQGLVENAIKHGLEPKPDGGTLTISAEIVHGKLAVTVADSGLGFGRAATAGTGIGLNNIRERLQLLYGSRASLTVAENPGGGTAVTITVPYTTAKQDATMV